MRKDFFQSKKRILALLLSAVVAVTAIPWVDPMTSMAFSSGYGVCIDNHNYSTSGSWSQNDKYSNKLKDMNQFTYGTPEYNEALQYNVQVLRQLLGSDAMILRVFWSGINCFVTNRKTFDGTGADLSNAGYWYSYIQTQYEDNVKKGNAPALPSYNFSLHMSESQLGTVAHGSAGDAIIASDPFLAAITNYDTFFTQVVPQLSTAWLQSYESVQSGGGGMALWPVNSQTHYIAVKGQPSKEEAQSVALNMDQDENYKSTDGREYIVKATEDFFFNYGQVVQFNNQTGKWEVSCEGIPLDGWIQKREDSSFKFTYVGDGNPTPLLFYFSIPSDSPVSASTITYNSPVEFCARYMKVYTCDRCGGTHPGSRALSKHQRHIAFYYSEAPRLRPVFMAGTDPISGPIPTSIHFDIFSHKEDWTTNYNVQLDKYDYETGKPLENAIFELYERFDDKDQINTERDGGVELYEGNGDGELEDESGEESDESEEWQSKYTSSPVIWDDFRVVGSYTTDENGHIETDVPKSYHYEKTFCDGHPSPQFAPVPEEELDPETGEVMNQDEIDAAQANNKSVAAQWMDYYENCQMMANDKRDGVHFHWKIEGVDADKIAELKETGGEPGDDCDCGPTECPGIDTAYESSGCKKDCEDTYEKLTELKYSYTWKEITAREGYMRHDIHTDDVPIEVITTNSSEAGAESEFADEYSKDIVINEEVSSLEPTDDTGNWTDDEEDSGESGKDEGDGGGNEGGPGYETTVLSKIKSLFTPKKSENASGKSYNLMSAQPVKVLSQETDAETDSDAVYSPSNSLYRLISGLIYDGNEALGNAYMKLANEDPDEGTEEGGYSAAYQAVYDAAFTDAFTGGEEVEIGPSDNYSHCNDIDGEGNSWRIYDHRTPGEIHFNKRDLDLNKTENDTYSSYSNENGDGDLEGAVYGLFAKNDIVHPDGKTGVVFKADDLVAVATTDRNGDGSFMAITEHPGSTYNYESGKIEDNDWAAEAPDNLFRKDAKSADVQPHVVFNDGNTTEWHSDDYTEDDTYKGGLTQRLYDDNEDNNMNCWIGRPLFMGEYYIKELSRSEGYELSVSGKSNDITNNGADLNIVRNKGNGSVWINRNLYIQPYENIGKQNELFFEVTSEGTNADGGYDIVLKNLPAGTKFYRQDSTLTPGTIQVLDHYEEVPVYDENGLPVYKRADIPGYPVYKGDGSDDYIEVEETVDYYAKNYTVAEIHEFDPDKIDEILNTDPDIMANTFSVEDMSNQFTFVKAKLEEILRSAGMRTPYAKSVIDGTTRYSYSTTTGPVYSRGIREGEADRYGVSGVTPGQPASRTVYGPQLVPVSISKNSVTGQTTNREAIMSLIQWYLNHPYWTFGGIDRMEDDGDNITVYLYAHNSMHPEGFVVAGDNWMEDSMVFKGVNYIPDDPEFEPYTIFAEYTYDDTDENFGLYDSLVKKKDLIGSDVFDAHLVPDAAIEDGAVVPKTEMRYKTYEVGEVMHDKDGNPIQETELSPVYVEKEFDQLKEEWHEIEARYDEDGNYVIHVDMPFTNMFGEQITDADLAKVLGFKAVIPERNHVLTQEEAALLPSDFDFEKGDILPSGFYELYVKRARAYVYLDYDAQTELSKDTYIAEVTLAYPTDEDTFQDGDSAPGSGTRTEPVQVLERPIKQQVLITKDIQVLPETKEVWYCSFCGHENADDVDICEGCDRERSVEETKTVSYAHDTYSAVHTGNLSTESRSISERVMDWLTRLINGDKVSDSVAHIPNFRFKSYLKSNLERLYRDEDGNIVWTDENGNVLKPNYSDTNLDGNYDTFDWTWTDQDNEDTKVIDFPEKSIERNDVLISSNVQKIYTQVKHLADSTTTGDISNTTWADYDTPQGGDRNEVGSLTAYSTSQDGQNGVAVSVNDSLYSYDGKNVNTAVTDRLNAEQNDGYTRVLESTVSAIEDRAGKTREVSTYNYKKFFDAIYTANTDKWDNDMFASGKNYPGQHWFETFYERYQKDDADTDFTLDNVDGTDSDGTAGGDRDTSFKPFRWIREKLFGDSFESKSEYPSIHDNPDEENVINTSAIAHENAEASDAVRQFAIDWYLKDEVAKLVINNGYDEDQAKNLQIQGTDIIVDEFAGPIDYSEQIYDIALYNALAKSVNYLKPFYDNDLDTIYSVEWDTAKNGGTDQDYTTLSIDNENAQDGTYYNISSYLPYGTYVIVEQQPTRIDGMINDFENKNYKTDAPKEVILPALYKDNDSNDTANNYDEFYCYDSSKTPEDLAAEYMIRFNEEWAGNHTDDLRNYVIRAHNYDGDFEIYKYGLDVDKLTDTITYDANSYSYNGYNIVQDDMEPYKDYYNPVHKTYGENITKSDGANDESHYAADDKNQDVVPSSGENYASDAIEERYHYGSISENAGTADNVIFPNGSATDDNNPSGFYFKDGVKTMTGNQTAYEGKFASMLVPWSVITPAELNEYDADKFMGYADINFRNTFYVTKLRIEKLDSETGENILHDDAVFALYAASRYTSQDEVDEAITNGAPATTKIGDVKFFLEDTQITGSYEFLKAMKADNIQQKRRIFGNEPNIFSGIVKAGTPVCMEEERIMLYDEEGSRFGDMTVYTTDNDVYMLDEDKEDKSYNLQNTGYFVTPQPIGAGVYVLAEIKPPTGYVRTNPIAIEVYSDNVSYYVDGDMYSHVNATVYHNNLITGANNH